MVHKALLQSSGLLAVAVMMWAALGGATLAEAHPEPAMVSPAWELTFEYQTPEAIAVPDVDGQPRWYWYMRYKVVNETGEARMFIPEVTIATDTGRIIDAGRNVPATVFTRIKEREREPLLKSPIDVVGTLLPGEDYARESVAIWPAGHEPVNEMRIFVGGLSGEVARAAHPATGEEVLFRRTRMLTYHLPGKPTTPQEQPIVLRDERDVMR